MTQWSTTTKHEPSSINNGRKYELRDRVSIEQLNNMTENSFYAMEASSVAKEKAEQALEHAVSGGSRVLENGQFVAEFNADKKVNTSDLEQNYYTKQEVDDILTGGSADVDLSNYYTKDETYSKEEVDYKLANLEVDIDFSDYYTKTETDSLVSTLQANVNKKLDRVDGSTSTALYGVGSSGQQVMFSVAQGTETNAIVRRSEQQIKVPLTPSVDNDATSKAYVDGLVNGIEIPNDYLPDTTKYGANIDLTIDSTTYVITAQLKDQNGNNLGSAKTIDLPLESVVVSGSYDNATKKVVLTLKDGSNVEFSVADLVSGLQSEITDLDTIRSNASAGKSASDTIAGYGDIVGYDKQEVVNEAKTKYKKVPTLPSSAEVEDNTVYLLQHTENGFTYWTEHIYIDGFWEQFGSNADVDIVGILDNTTKIATQLGGFSAGLGSSVTGSGGAIGENALAGSGGAIGENTRTNKGFAGGYNAQTLKKIDENTTSTSDAIQLGTGTNYKEKSLQVYDDNIYDANTHTLTVQNIELNGEDLAGKLGSSPDAELSEISTNSVQNKVVTAEFNTRPTIDNVNTNMLGVPSNENWVDISLPNETTVYTTPDNGYIVVYFEGASGDDPFKGVRLFNMGSSNISSGSLSSVIKGGNACYLYYRISAGDFSVSIPVKRGDNVKIIFQQVTINKARFIPSEEV